jgi:hypothetical protein
MNIELLAIPCAKLDAYARLVERVVTDLGLDATVEKLTDNATFRANGIFSGCSPAYCAGCNRTRIQKEFHYTPAMVVNGKVEIHSRFPDKNDIRNVLADIQNQQK